MHWLRKFQVFRRTLRLFILLPVLFASETVIGQVVINEVDSDTPGNDNLEFIELYDGGSGDTPLDGLVVVLFNGSDDASYAAFDLDGFSTDADGYFLMGDASVVPMPSLLFGSVSLQNGADAVALYADDAANFPNDTPVTTTNLIDAIVYDTGDPDDPGLLVLLNPGQPQVDEDGAGDKDTHSNQRLPNGSGGKRNTDTYAQFLPTPGTANQSPPQNSPPVLTSIPDQTMMEEETLDIGVSATDPDNDPIVLSTNNLPNFGSLTDNGDGTGTLTFTPGVGAAEVYPDIVVIATDDSGLADTTSFDLTVNVGNQAPVMAAIPDQTMDEGETLDVDVSATDPENDPITLSTNNLPPFGNLSDNGNGSGTLTFTPDFNSAGVYANIDVIATDDGGLADTTSFTLTVNEMPLPSVLINELDADTPGSDALEFIELYDGGSGNTDLDGLVIVLFNGSNDKSYGAFDLDGFTTDASGYFLMGNAGVVPNPVFPFSNGTLQNGADAVALFAGNASDFPNGTSVTTRNLIDAIVYDTDDPDASGLLGLLNAGQPQVNENGGGDKDNHSNQRIPNGSGGARNTDTYAQLVPTPGSVNLSPPPNSPPVLISIPDQTMNEGEALDVAVTATDPENDPITLSVSNLPGFGSFVDNGDGTGLLTFDPSFDEAGTYPNITLIAIDDQSAADTTTFQLTVLNVEPAQVLINELDSDTPGSDMLEFVELFGEPDAALDGLVLVFFNGTNDKSYAAFDLDGFTTDAAGYFLAGNSAVNPSPQLVFNNARLQNGADAVGLYQGNADDFPNGTPVTTDNLVDAVVYGTGDPDDDGLLQLLHNDQPQVDEDLLNDKERHAIQRFPNGTGGARNSVTFLPASPTPGSENRVFGEIAVTPRELEFGELEIGTQSEFQIEIANRGLVTLSVQSVTIEGRDAADWLYKDRQTFLVAPGVERKRRICFAPATTGVKNAELVIVSDDPDESPLSIPLHGSAVAIPKISSNTEELKFRNVRLGSHEDRRFTLFNDGSAVLVVERAFLRGSNTDQFDVLNLTPSFTLNPGEYREFEVRFQPTSVGIKRAHLRFMSNDPDDPEFNIVFTGMGITGNESQDLNGIVVINEIHYNPSASQGSDTEFEFLELINTSDEDVSLLGLSFSEGITHTFTLADTLPGSGFLVIANNAETYPNSIEWTSGNLVNGGELIKLLDPNGATIDSVEYGTSSPWPTSPNGGGPSLELRNPLLDNTVPENWLASTVVGGTPGASNSASQPQLVVTPQAIDFGTHNLNAMTSAIVRTENIGGDTLRIDFAELSGVDADQFTLEADSNYVLLPGDSAGVTVILKPTSTGAKAALLRIASNDPDQSSLEIPLNAYINSPPLPPVILEPADGETAETLVWQASVDPDSGDILSYILQLDTEPGFAEDASALEGLMDTTIAVAEVAMSFPFENDSLYFWRVQAVDNHGAKSAFSHSSSFKFLSDPTTAITEKDETVVPETFSLAQNFPNPFNPATQIRFELASKAVVTLVIFDLLGNEVVRLVDKEERPAGRFHLSWKAHNHSGTPVASGVYLYRLIIEPVEGDRIPIMLTRKMLFIK